MATVFALAISQAQAAPEGSRYNAEYFTNLPVTTQNGETVPFYDTLIKGKMVVVTFVYTTCNDICPLTTARIARIKERLGDAVGRDVFFYSITLDPERDTPEALKLYADAFGAGDGWLFLTGKPEDIKRIRHRLGDRSRKLSEHRNDMMIGHEVTGDWSRTSIYADLDVAVSQIQRLDPVYRATKHKVTNAVANIDRKVYRIDQQPGQALFLKACASCHSIGRGNKIGPDLKDIAKRRDRDWLTRFLMAPDEMRDIKDPLTMEISKQYPGVKMPNLSLEKNDVDDLLQYIETHSRSAKAEKPPVEPEPGGKAPGG
jgi:protein SCO1/2